MKAIIISKVTSLEHYHRKLKLSGDALLKGLTAQGIPATTLFESNAIHEKTLQVVQKTLVELGVSYTLHTTENRNVSTKGVNLIIAVGGDGTFLSTSHLIQDNTPLLNINSDPQRSKGYLACCDKKDVSKKLRSFFAGKARLCATSRLQIGLPDAQHVPLALNDVFLCGKRPFDTVKYEMQVGKKVARHADSGLLICTGAGSTAWTYNASRIYPVDVAKILALDGKKVSAKKVTSIADMYNKELPFAWDAKKMRYFARDLIIGGTSSARLHAGFATSISLYSLMYEGLIVVDNKYSFDFSHGKRATISIQPGSLFIVL